MNDVSGGDYDPKMYALIASKGIPYIVMHMRGEPQNMLDQRHSTYKNVTREVFEELHSKLLKLDSSVPRWLQIIDPGFGFSKGFYENAELLSPLKIASLKSLLGNRPFMVGLSRKRLLGKAWEVAVKRHHSVILDEQLKPMKALARDAAAGAVADPDLAIALDEKDLMSAAAHCMSLGTADILRVHNVKTTRLVCETFSALSTAASRDTSRTSSN